jgi:hypothetical protein
MASSRPRIDVPDDQANRAVVKTAKEMRDVLDPPGKPKATACSTCPHRAANFNGITAHGERWDVAYSNEARDKLWTGDLDPAHPENAMRSGAVNPCHQTQDRPCAGAVVLQERELIRWCRRGSWSFGTGKHDLTELGVVRIWRRMFNSGEKSESDPFERWRLPGADLCGAAHPAINDPNIGHEALAPPAPGEFDQQ